MSMEVRQGSSYNGDDKTGEFINVDFYTRSGIFSV
jgi:hypothetical protein